MLEAHSTITEGGRIIIPSSIRKALDLKVGEEVILKVESGELHISSYKHAIKRAQELVRKHNKNKISLTAELFKMRREESKDEG